MTETVEKLSRIRKYLKAQKLDGIVLNTRANFAWLSGGGDNHVVSQSEHGVGALVVTPKQAFLVANRIEVDRLHNEEPLTSFTPKSFPWTQSLSSALAKLLTGKKNVSDDAATGLPALPSDFVYEVRASLCDNEVRRYKALGRDCSLAIETVARQVQKGDSEHQVEADLARHLLARGIQPYVVLVAFDQRIERYRHPTPTANHLRHCGMLVLCGQRGGLIASLTRLIHFGPVAKELLAKHEAVCRVDAALWNATVPGATYGAALKAGLDQYKKEGFAKEWELHHQGGPTGYAGRDFMATPDEKRQVLDHQAVAWNPSITGTKSEDTFITEGSTRVVLTACSPDWPTVTVKTPGGEPIVRPGILVR
jgi:Xaa-Pro aminopeptidase